MNVWWVPDAAGREVARYCWVVEVTERETDETRNGRKATGESQFWALPLRSPRRDTPAWAFRRPYSGPALDPGKTLVDCVARLVWGVAGIPSEETADAVPNRG